MEGRLKIEGLRQLRRLLRDAGGKPMTKELGKVHKDIGALVIDRLQPKPDPAAVGTGRGAPVRPSASTREVLLLVGGKHRENHRPQMQWGKKPGPLAFRKRPPRPNVLGTAVKHSDDISERYLKGVERILWNMDVS